MVIFSDMVPLHECPCLLTIVSIDSNSLMNPNYRPAAVDEIPAGWPRSRRACAEWRVTMRPSLFTLLRLDTLGRETLSSRPGSKNTSRAKRRASSTPFAGRPAGSDTIAKRRDGVALDRRRHDGGGQRLPSIKSLSTCPFSELRLQLTNPSASPNELNTTLTPHSMTHGDACFAYFNKVWGIPGRFYARVYGR